MRCVVSERSNCCATRRLFPSSRGALSGDGDGAPTVRPVRSLALQSPGKDLISCSGSTAAGRVGGIRVKARRVSDPRASPSRFRAAWTRCEAIGKRRFISIDLSKLLADAANSSTIEYDPCLYCMQYVPRLCTFLVESEVLSATWNSFIGRKIRRYLKYLESGIAVACSLTSRKLSRIWSSAIL